jgi:hypothetical protein
MCVHRGLHAIGIENQMLAHTGTISMPLGHHFVNMSRNDLLIHFSIQWRSNKSAIAHGMHQIDNLQEYMKRHPI